MKPNILVVRHSASGAPLFLSRHVSCSIINAGDGANEHPSQGLLDLYTILKVKGKIAGLKIAIVGISSTAVSSGRTSTPSGGWAQGCGCADRPPRSREMERTGAVVTSDIREAVRGPMSSSC